MERDMRWTVNTNMRTMLHIQVKKISRPHGIHFTSTSGLRIYIYIYITTTTLWIYGKGDLVNTVDAFIIQMHFILFYFILFHFIFGFSAMSTMRLYANRTSESDTGSGIPLPSKMSACHSHAKVTHAFTYDDVNSRRPLTRLLSVTPSPLFAINLTPRSRLLLAPISISRRAGTIRGNSSKFQRGVDA